MRWGWLYRCRLRNGFFFRRPVEQYARDDDPEQREEQREEVDERDEQPDAEDKRDPSRNVVVPDGAEEPAGCAEHHHAERWVRSDPEVPVEQIQCLECSRSDIIRRPTSSSRRRTTRTGPGGPARVGALHAAVERAVVRRERDDLRLELC